MTTFDVEIRKDSRGTWVSILGHDGDVTSVRAQGWLLPDAPAASPEMTGKQIHDALLRHRRETGRPLHLA